MQLGINSRGKWLINSIVGNANYFGNPVNTVRFSAEFHKESMLLWVLVVKHMHL